MRYVRNYPIMVSRRQFLHIATVGTLALAGCTGDSGGQSPTEQMEGTTTAPSDGGAGRVVEMVNTAFDPVTASVDPGTTVKWVNNDGLRHDVTAAHFHDTAASWEFSKTLSGGESTTFTFDEQGVYEYYCTIHGKGTMCGAVLVGDVTLEKSLPCESGSDGGGNGGEGY